MVNEIIRFAATRLLTAGLMVLTATSLVFLAIRAVGNPIELALSGRLPDAEIARRVSAAGLDRPLMEQYIAYFNNLLEGSLGLSTITQESVVESISKVLPATIELGVSALLVAALLSLPIGMFLARRQGSAIDKFSRLAGVIAYATPIFLAAMVFRLIFSIAIPAFPSQGRLSLSANNLNFIQQSSGFYLFDSFRMARIDTLIDAIHHLLLPSLTLGLTIAAVFSRVIRNLLIKERGQTHFIVARNRFGDGLFVDWNYTVRPNSVGILTTFGVHAIAVLTGLIFIEKVFEWRGVGYLLTEAILERDYGLVQGITVIIALTVGLINFIVAMISAYLDPRHIAGDR